MNAIERLEQWVDESQALDRYSAEVQQYVKLLFESERSEQLLSVLNGDWMGHPLHPVMTDMAIGGYTVAWFLDIIAAISDDDSLRKSADDAMLVGLLSALGTIVTGLADWSHTEDYDRRLGFLHALTNATGNALYLAAYLVRKSNRPARFWLSQLGATVITAAAYMGGMLVYNEGSGVKKKQQGRTPVVTQEIDSAVPYSMERLNSP